MTLREQLLQEIEIAPDNLLEELLVVHLCKGWREFRRKSLQHFDSNLIIVVMNEIPNRCNMVLQLL